jgi:hypothetical protein
MNDPTQTDPDVLHRAMTRTLIPNNDVVQAKLFHHNNLVLQLLFDRHFSVYTINVYRVNDRTDSNLWGLFTELKDAQSKFERIRL